MTELITQEILSEFGDTGVARNGREMIEMKRKTAALGCCLCALTLGLLGASSAGAATNGTTGTASGSAWTGPVAGTAGEVLLHSVISGVNVELKATAALYIGNVTEMLDFFSGEHTASGKTELTPEFTGVTVVKPAEKGCAAYKDTGGGPGVGGYVEGKTTTGTTAGQGMGVKFEPFTGSTLASFYIQGCSGSKALEALNGKYEVTGSVIGVPSGSTVEFTAAATTSQGTLKLRGQKAGLNGSFELEAFNGFLGTGVPLEASTVETP